MVSEKEAGRRERRKVKRQGKGRQVWSFFKTSVKEFAKDDCPRMAAALAYYTVFSLPPLLVLVITVAGAVWAEEAVTGQIESQIRGVVGPQGARAVQTMIANASEAGGGATLATVLGVAALVFGATGAFAQLQKALNAAWEVEPDPESGGLKGFLSKRLLSLGMVLAVAFLLLVSLALSAILQAAGDYVSGRLGGLSGTLLGALNAGVSLLVVTLLFAAIYKVLPDARIAWRDVLVGALLTSLLFALGKWAISLYLGTADIGSTYGAAGSLAVILVWVYYASMVLLLGAEMTQVWAQRYGSPIVPEEGAVRVVTEKRRVREAGAG